MSADLHPQVRALIEASLADGDEPGPPDLEAERAAYLQTALELGGAVEEVARVEDVVIPDAEGGRMRARAYWPTVPAEPLGVLVWLHGGGWYVGDIESFDRVTRQLANASGAVCLSVDYRLAPEHPYPAAGPRRALRGRLGGRRRRAAAGHRSGPRGRSAATAPAPTSRRSPPATSATRVRAQLLVYPALDAAMDSDSYREFADGALLRAAGHGALLEALPRRRRRRRRPTRRR